MKKYILLLVFGIAFTGCAGTMKFETRLDSIDMKADRALMTAEKARRTADICCDNTKKAMAMMPEPKFCDCEAKFDYPAPEPPCICLYYKGKEFFCAPDNVLVVNEANPVLAIYPSNDEITHVGIEGFGYEMPGKARRYDLSLKPGETRRIKILGLFDDDEEMQMLASQWCKIKRK